jgi:predicted TIM-barrel fold metal-dependent hydrolase
VIIDSHCHAWAYWPYQPPVPDPEGRGRVEQLLHEMNLNEVERALVVCAQIDHNPQNNEYVADACRRHPDRLHQVADVDSLWSDTYHQPGASARLRAVADRWPLAGFTHYLKFEDDGNWLFSYEGLAFFEVAAERGLLASISCHPHHQAAIRRVAGHFPEMPILIHHLGHPKVQDPDNISEILASAAQPNIYIKISGFYYSTAGPRWDFPYRDVYPFVKAIYETFGAGRMCWGSDYPVVRRAMTYPQSLAVIRAYCDFIPAEEQAQVLGGTLARLLDIRVDHD